MDQSAWQAQYLRRREWVRTIIRLLSLIIAVLGLTGSSRLTAGLIAIPLGGGWADLLVGAASPFTYLSVAAALAWFSTRLSRWIVPLPEPGCPRCGYSLSNLRSPICPECGLDLRPPTGGGIAGGGSPN